jgi:uncharacterized protein (DUF885 family)
MMIRHLLRPAGRAAITTLLAATALAAPAAALQPAAAAAAAPRDPALAAAIEAYARFEARFPMEAGRSDPPRSRDGWPKESPADMAERRTGLAALAKQLAAVDGSRLSSAERADRDFLAAIIGWRIEGIDFDERRFAFVAHEGFYNVPLYAARNARVTDRASGEAWLARLRAIPSYFDAQRANLDRGIATGWTQPAMVVDVAVDVLRRQVETPLADEPLLAPLAGQPELRAAAEAVVRDQVRPAQRAMLAYIDGTYRAAARKEIGISAIPGGRAYFDFLLRFYTTTDLDAETIHAMGQAEIRRIRGEMDALLKEAGFAGSFADWQRMLRTDPRFYAASREDLLEKAAAAAKRIDALLPRWFGLLPRQPFTVEPVPAALEEGYTTARYGGGDYAAGQPGRFIVNTSHLDQRPLYELPSLALHEAAPGHHTHSALVEEATHLPAFRRSRDLVAFREGWALYAERIGHEMGVYRDVFERFGALSNEMWRACRMVVDTGIHAMGWSYDQARACFTDNTALADINIDTELKRYVGAPGGAVAYKVGELRIVALRQQAEAALGPRFDIRAFHDLVLAQGQVPLSVLDTVVADWIAAQGRASPPAR